MAIPTNHRKISNLIPNTKIRIFNKSLNKYLNSFLLNKNSKRIYLILSRNRITKTLNNQINNLSKSKNY